MAEDPSIAGLSFSDPQVAYRAREVIRQIASNQVEIKGSNPNVGRVMSIDIARLTASVWFPGDDAPVQVGMFPGNVPLDLGDFRGTSTYETSAVGTGGLVYVEQFRGKPYITQILSGGEYTLNQRVAGLTHQTFNANRRGTISGPPVADIYERHVNIKVDGGDVTVGQCLLVGPWAGNNDGSQIDGIIEMTISFIVAGATKNCVRKYQFSISDRMVVDLEGDEGNKAFWMRLIPETTLQTDPHAELAIDVALVKTAIRAPIEFWFRLVPLDTFADQSIYLMSVKSYGSAFNVGDPRTGRMVTIKQATVEPLQGYLGFHNSGMGFVERDEWPTYNQGISWWADEWSTGPFRAAPLRAANDLRPTWRLINGSFKYTADHFLSWTGSIQFTGIGPNNNILHTGVINVPFPAQNLPIFPTASIGTYRSVGGGQIGMLQGEVLYYGLCPSIGQAVEWPNFADHFFIVDSKSFNSSTKSFALPEWAIPIAARAHTFRDGAKELFICSPHGEQMIDNEHEYAQAWYTASHGPFVVNDETETMEIPSFTYRKGQAYKLSFKCGLVSSTAGDAVMSLRWKKGTTAAGADLGEHFRYWLPRNTFTAGFAQGETYICNNTGADITTAITLTGTVPTGAPASSRYANATTKSWVRSDWVGPASKYTDIARPLT